MKPVRMYCIFLMLIVSFNTQSQEVIDKKFSEYKYQFSIKGLSSYVLIKSEYPEIFHKTRTFLNTLEESNKNTLIFDDNSKSFKIQTSIDVGEKDFSYFYSKLGLELVSFSKEVIKN